MEIIQHRPNWKFNRTYGSAAKGRKVRKEPKLPIQHYTKYRMAGRLLPLAPLIYVQCRFASN
jgi:hypothetical protein